MQGKKIKILTLVELTAAVQQQLINLRYSPTTLCIYDCIWRDLIDFCIKNSILLFDENVGIRFAKEKYDHLIGESCKKDDDFRKKTVVRAMQYLLDYQAFGVVFECSSRGQYNWKPPFKKVFDAYIAEMIKVGYAKSTLITIKSCLKGFETYLLQKNFKALSELERSDIEAFILTFTKYAKSTLPNRIYYLKMLLNFAYQQGHTTENLSTVCPHVRRTDTHNSIPSTFTAEEVKAILAAVDRANPCGKRDYAILLMVTKLGLRATDICELKISDIDWHQQIFNIFQSKTKQMVVLPLLDDIGWAIIDYLKNGRPQLSSEHLFLKHNGDFSRLETNPYCMLQKYLRRTGIASEYERRHGLHALRHSLASELLSKHIPLPVISGILGHANSDTTSVYLKIDIPELRRCALEVGV